MELSCNYHNDQSASWACEGCQKDFCDTCVPAGNSRHWGAQGAKCTLCNRGLTYLGMAGGAKPFWQMIPHFLAYPFQSRVIVLIVLGALSTKFLGAGLLTVFLGLFFSAVMVKYGFAIIEARGRGELSAPGITDVIQGDQDHLFLKQVAVFFLMGAATAYAYSVGEVLGVIAAGFVALAIPASTIILAVEKSLRRALNPLALLAMMTTIGFPYVLLWFCVQLISSGPVYAVEWLAGGLPESLILPVLAGLSIYFAMATYCMLGYVLFQYQHELGFVHPGIDDENLSSKEFRRARALAEVSILVHEGEYERARKQLRHALDEIPDDIALHDRYHKLLLLLDDDNALKNHAEYFIDLCIRFGQKGKTASIYLDVQGRIPGFQLSNLEQACLVAEMLLEQGKPKILLHLLLNVHKSHPKSPDVARAYLLVARVYAEYLGQEAKARQLLLFIRKQYPDTPYKHAVDNLLGQLQVA